MRFAPGRWPSLSASMLYRFGALRAYCQIYKASQQRAGKEATELRWVEWLHGYFIQIQIVMAKTQSIIMETGGFSMNGKGKEPSIEELQAQFEALGKVIAEKQEAAMAANRPKNYPPVVTNTVGRMKSLTWILFLGLIAGALYNYVVINDLSMRPIDAAGLQKVLLSVIVFFSALLLVEKALRYFVPYLHQYFVNDRASEQDFSTHLQELQPWQLVCVTCFFIGLFFWGFVTLLTVKW